MSSESGSSSNCCTEQRKEEGDFEIKKPPCSHIPSVDTEELSEEQKTIVTIVRKMLEEEVESFSQTDDYVRRALIQYHCRKDTTPFPNHFMLRSNSM